MTIALIAIYLAAIVTANLAVATFGPSITPLTAFLLIGLDLTTRDVLHDRWEYRALSDRIGRAMPLRMGALITAGSLAPSRCWSLGVSTGGGVVYRQSVSMAMELTVTRPAAAIAPGSPSNARSWVSIG
jgi:hypothetical protein